ncbi:MAG: hypothetical protein GY950_31215 [bacterium]|nr:hypothetical protein [bacterium]
MKRYFNLKVVTIVLVFFMMAVSLQLEGARLPDLSIVRITVDRSCHVAVVVKNNGPGRLPDYVYTKTHPKSAGVYIYVNGKGWGGIAIKGFDPARKLQRPGGTATYISRYKVSTPVDIKAVVDMHNTVREANERNNTKYRRKLSCGGTSTGKRLPDLIVRDIRLIRNCKIQVTVKNIGTAGVPASYYDNPKAVAVQMYNGGKPWGGIILKGFDPAGKLKSPGGTATHIWFPRAANLNLGAGTHSIKVVVDSGKVLTELKETNNSLTRRLNCKKLTLAKPVATVATANLSQLAIKPPTRFFVDFKNAHLIYRPATKTLQVITGNKVLAYGGGFDKCQLKPYLYHLRLKTWKNFYWKVNTSRKEVYKVTGGSFCKLGGSEQKLNIKVDTIGGSGNTAPSAFFLRFHDAYLAYSVATKSIQIIAQLCVLSYGGDWDKCNLNAFTYHLKNKFAQTFYWKVNTTKKKAVEVTGGTFCSAGGSETPLNFGVRVVK